MIISDNDASIRYSKTIQIICQELFKKTPLNFFIYARFYPDGSVINLTTKPEWHKYYRKKNYHVDIEKRLIEGVHSWRSNDNTANHSQEAKKLFDIYNKLEIVEYHKSYIESFGYGGGKEDGDLDDFYLNNINILRTYNKIFLSKAYDIINSIELNNEYLYVPIKSYPLTKGEQIIFDLPSYSNNQSLEFSYYSQGERFSLLLTPTQFNILILKIRGYTDSFIAETLNFSTHNVKYHYKNILKNIHIKGNDTIYTVCEKAGIYDVSKFFNSLIR